MRSETREMTDVRAMSKLFGNGPRPSGKLLGILAIALILLILNPCRPGRRACRKLALAESRQPSFLRWSFPRIAIARGFSKQEEFFFLDNFTSGPCHFLASEDDYDFLRDQLPVASLRSSQVHLVAENDRFSQ